MALWKEGEDPQYDSGKPPVPADELTGRLLKYYKIAKQYMHDHPDSEPIRAWRKLAWDIIPVCSMSNWECDTLVYAISEYHKSINKQLDLF